MIQSPQTRPATSPSRQRLPLSTFSRTGLAVPFSRLPLPNSPNSTQLDTPVPPQPPCFQSHPHTFRHTWGCPSVSTSNFELSTRHRSFRTFPHLRPHQCHSASLSGPLFSYSCALFCTKQNAISRILNHLRTLCTNHRGGVRTRPFIRSPFRRNLLLARSTAVVTRGHLERAATSQDQQRSAQIPTSPNMLKWTCT
jgi:hypothetical protein